MRFIVLELLLIATPLIAYRLYAGFIARKRAEVGPNWNDGPVTWLLILGLVLAIAAIGFLGFSGDKVIDGTYNPATYEEGELTPSSIDEEK
jgi:hypothetical protein